MKHLLATVLAVSLVMLPVGNHLQASGSISEASGLKAFRNAARTLFTTDGLAPDPHLFLTAARLHPLLAKTFGRETALKWRHTAMASLCHCADEEGAWVGCGVRIPYLPDLPTCQPQPDLHANAQLLLALCAAELYETSGGMIGRESVKNWLLRHIAVDALSPGIETEALVLAGLAPDDTWTAADGTRWRLRRLLDTVIVTWRRTLAAQRLRKGQILPDRLLHLAPALTAVLTRHPSMKPYYAPVLEEVFSVYRDTLHKEGYWGYPGETFCTGHIIEQYIQARRAGLVEALPFSRPLSLMIRHQAPSGWFDIASNRFAGAHAHGLMALGAALLHPGILPEGYKNTR